ncbi:MAG: ATP phosphoribosyltransferase regulatory subunit [Paracoccaceae bacterium]
MLAARAYLKEGRRGTALAELQAETRRLLSAFEQAGAEQVEPGALLPADLLLDLYGEDIRARAYVTDDPVNGEQVLRPDFTVPVVQMHMAGGAEPARCTYAGPVWRRQEPGSPRPTEYLQVGYEVFGGDDPAAADAEVFALFSSLLADEPLRAVTGDIGVLLAAIAALRTTERRKAALRRHVWRPVRFRRLLDRFSGRVAVSQSRQRLLAEGRPGGVPLVGLRSAEEIDLRIAVLREEAATAPLSDEEVARFDALAELRVPVAAAADALARLAGDAPELAAAAERLARRSEALVRLGIDVEGLVFDAGYGRTTMEYYDGFVFGFEASGRTDLPPIATGGRYDALTRVLGQGRGVPAAGGIIRPEALLSLRAGRS